MPRSTLTSVASIGGRDAGAKQLASFDRALSLDPRNARIACEGRHTITFLCVTGPAAVAGYKRALEIAPDYLDSKIGLAYLEVVSKRQPRCRQEYFAEHSSRH